MKNNTKNLIKIAATVFIMMFIFRLIYGYIYPKGMDRNNFQIHEDYSSNNLKSKINIASKRIQYKSNEGITKSIDQKYEKIADIDTVTNNFENDEAQIRKYIISTNSVIQFENTSGLKENKNRIIKFQIGVPPDKFDDSINKFKTIGTLIKLNINKKDKTNEYKELQSKKESLLKIRSSLLLLKQKGGKIDEYINLENRILEIEENIQKLGLSLGEFDSENEFCTIDLTVKESKSFNNLSLIYRIKVALEWTIKYYFILSIGLLFFALFMYVSIIILEKLKSLLKQKNEA